MPLIHKIIYESFKCDVIFYARTECVEKDWCNLDFEDENGLVVMGMVCSYRLG